MRKPNAPTEASLTIRPIRKADLTALVALHLQFEAYLRRLDPHRKLEPLAAFRSRLVRDGFGKHRAFHGFIALCNHNPVGYVFYHDGYDPDEMQGRVVYVIDLYVSDSQQRKGIGSDLMHAVASRCHRMKGIAVYFGVWDRNKGALSFYSRLGASHDPELLFFHWQDKQWKRLPRKRPRP